MTTVHRKSPKRKVLEIRRSGAWGKVNYEHMLECGHTEKRARASSAPKLACAMCYKLKTKELEVSSLKAPARILTDDYDSVINTSETVANRLRAAISANLKLPQDAIDVVLKDSVGELQISYVQIFLSASDAYRVAGLTKP